LIKGLYHPVNRNVLISKPNCPSAAFSSQGDELVIKFNQTKPNGSGKPELRQTATYKGCYALRDVDNEFVETLD